MRKGTKPRSTEYMVGQLMELFKETERDKRVWTAVLSNNNFNVDQAAEAIMTSGIDAAAESAAELARQAPTPMQMETELNASVGGEPGTSSQSPTSNYQPSKHQQSWTAQHVLFGGTPFACPTGVASASEVELQPLTARLLATQNAQLLQQVEQLTQALAELPKLVAAEVPRAVRTYDDETAEQQRTRAQESAFSSTFRQIELAKFLADLGKVPGFTWNAADNVIYCDDCFKYQKSDDMEKKAPAKVRQGARDGGVIAGTYGHHRDLRTVKAVMKRHLLSSTCEYRLLT